MKSNHNTAFLRVFRGDKKTLCAFQMDYGDLKDVLIDLWRFKRPLKVFQGRFNGFQGFFWSGYNSLRTFRDISKELLGFQMRSLKPPENS